MIDRVDFLYSNLELSSFTEGLVRTRYYIVIRLFLVVVSDKPSVDRS